MGELLPDSWSTQVEEQKCCHQRRSSRKGPVSDILLWAECYATMVSVLATKYPQKTPQLMAYQRTILKAHRAFTGEGWVTYDTCYRRKAALMKSLDWGVVDFTLYNETFTGRAKVLPRCRHCSSEHHPSHACSYAPDQATESQQAPSRSRPARSPMPICQLYNGKHGDRCHFSPCKFRHVCRECQGTHPACNCGKRRQPPSSRPRSRSPRCRP